MMLRFLVILQLGLASAMDNIAYDPDGRCWNPKTGVYMGQLVPSQSPQPGYHHQQHPQSNLRANNEIVPGGFLPQPIPTMAGQILCLPGPLYPNQGTGVDHTRYGKEKKINVELFFLDVYLDFAKHDKLKFFHPPSSSGAHMYVPHNSAPTPIRYLNPPPYLKKRYLSSGIELPHFIQPSTQVPERNLQKRGYGEQTESSKLSQIVERGFLLGKKRGHLNDLGKVLLDPEYIPPGGHWPDPWINKGFPLAFGELVQSSSLTIPSYYVYLADDSHADVFYYDDTNNRYVEYIRRKSLGQRPNIQPRQLGLMMMAQDVWCIAGFPSHVDYSTQTGFGVDGVGKKFALSQISQGKASLEAPAGGNPELGWGACNIRYHIRPKTALTRPRQICWIQTWSSNGFTYPNGNNVDFDCQPITLSRTVKKSKSHTFS